MSFATYRNQLRMEYAKKMIVSGYLNQNTIEALT
jgi:YesN/AraC family two-component response regulator